jgi:hypothetical protein
MNPERRCLRRKAGLLAVMAVSLLLAPAVSQEAAKPGTDAPKANDFHILALKYARAADVARLLQEMYATKGEPTLRVTAEPITNQVLVSAPAAQLAEIRAILAKIDVAADNEAVRRINVYQLRFIEPDKALEDALRLVFGPGAAGNFALDRAHKQVIVSASEPVLKEVDALLNRLDARPVEQTFEDVQLRVVWLANSPARDEKAVVPPDDLKEVLPGLAKLGIDRPHLVAQTLVNVTPGTEYRVKGVAKLDTPCHFSVTGRFVYKKDTPSLDISLHAMRDRERGQDDVCNLQTEINAPLGHLVVLGVTPTDSVTSVFVVQVLRRETKKPGAPR